MRRLFLHCFLFVSLLTKGQCVITGIVRESGNQQPIPFVNIYLASTTTGTYTNDKGIFSFRVTQHGLYDLVASFVGYETVHIPVMIDTASTLRFEISMVLKNYELRSVTIRADTSNRRQDFWEFKRIFLGDTENAARCRIKNPKDIHLFYDRSLNLLSAFAKVPIVVENKALGYRIYYDLQKFEVFYDSNTYHIWGTSRFEEMVPENEATQKRWAKAREKAYHGSMTHLMRSILANELREEGWEAVIMYGKIRPADYFIREKIRYFKKMGIQDSVDFYNYIKELPPGSHLVSNRLYGHELLAKTNPHKLSFKGTLSVSFVKEELPMSSELIQNSEVYIIRKGMLLYDNGFFEPQRNVKINGYLSRTERISEFVPYNYKPLSKSGVKKDIALSD